VKALLDNWMRSLCGQPIRIGFCGPIDVLIQPSRLPMLPEKLALLVED
jgi:hypothetical protein